jgi:hypothetical protein
MKFSKETKVPKLFRIAFLIAGLFIFTGIILSIFINQWFLLLSAMVGVGLWISALLGYCPMAMLLEKVFDNESQ